MGVNKLRKICIYILAIFLIFSPIVVFDYSNNEKIEKEIKTAKNIKSLDQEGQNYRLVTSADNVQVPVPKGYVASNVTGENYVTPEYQHTTIPHKGIYTELSWNSPAGEQYPWTQDENGIWISGNQGIPSSTSTLESEEFDYIKGTTLTINYTFSCQNSYNSDYLNIYLINITNNTTTRIVENKSGNTSASFDYTTSNKTYTMNDWATGRYKIRAIYSKNASIDGGQDSSYIKPSTYFKEDENGETIEIDQKTKIHDGGFVIYELTDAELETDPNGTSININNTNKDEAQRTRNQYVWVPVPNIEDIVITKEENNGIMQFGQGYIFSNTSISKETNTGNNLLREPRIVERYDKTKYYLQRYSNINKRENYLNEQQEEFKNMIKSVEKYGGYYLGRYETGDDYTHSSSKECFLNPRVVRYNSNINYATWYNSYDAAKRLSGNKAKYVKTGMIYDTMWDYTLKWLNETDTRSYEDINKDSGTWGNYSNNTKTTQSGGTSPARTGAIEIITYKGVTYNDSPTSSNNIFDIAGNVWEWTSSRNDAGVRRYRGGGFGNDSNVYSAEEDGEVYPGYSSNGIGVRAQLYIL